MSCLFCQPYLILNVPQSGLATKAEKASRKLRKERKNRAKKVAVSCIVHSLPLTHPNSSAVPRRRRLQNLPKRASRHSHYYSASCMHVIQGVYMHIFVNIRCHAGIRPQTITISHHVGFSKHRINIWVS